MREGEKEALEALRGIYARLETEQGGKDECRACGECCRFETFGHRLYVSYLEARYLIEVSGRPPRGTGPDVCGYQRGAECTARAGRPLACRTFFCAEAGAYRPEVLEAALKELRGVCERFQVPWGYRPLHENLDILLRGSFTEVL